MMNDRPDKECILISYTNVNFGYEDWICKNVEISTTQVSLNSKSSLREIDRDVYKICTLLEYKFSIV